jgi:hypothetical protein
MEIDLNGTAALHLRPRLVANVFGFIVLAFGLVFSGRLTRLFFAL